MEHKHRVEIEYTRRVGSRFMNRVSTTRVVIPYGKAHTVKTGKDAFEMAKRMAREGMETASRVCIFMMNGNNGTGTDLKNNNDEYFDVGYDGKGL